MAWVVDTCVVLDVACDDPQHGKRSAKFLGARLKDNLVLCPVTLIELAPQFNADMGELRNFCELSGLSHSESWSDTDTENAARVFSYYIELKRQKHSLRRPIADILIGAFAMRFQGLITRNPQDFKTYLPKLKILEL